MLIPKPWLQKFVDLSGISDSEFAEKMTFAGNKVESVQNHKLGTVFEFEITSNRPDTLSVIGIAREVSAVFNRELKLPKIAKPKLLRRQPLSMKILDKDLCPSHSIVEISSVKVKPSSRELQDFLEMSGVRPINNIVDITNYLMLETGQPMHAFDADKLEGPLKMRAAKQKEKIVTIDHKERILSPEEFVIEDQKKLVHLVGLMGGLNSEISEKTTRILLHVPVYDSAKVRRASKRLRLRTEGSNRFEKKLDLHQTELVALRTIELLEKEAGGKQTSAIKTVMPTIKPIIIQINPQILEKYTGLVLTEKEIGKILLKVGIIKTPKGYEVPSFRRDLSIPADLIEEVVRIYGYNNLKKTLPIGEIPTNPDALAINYDRKLRQLIANQGYTETYASTLIGKNLIERLKLKSQDHLKVLHPMSSDFEYMRTTTAETILPAIETNLNSGASFSVFELGTVFYPKPATELPDQPQELAIATNCKSYKQIKGDLESILRQLSLDLDLEPVKNNLTPFLHPFKQAKIICGGEIIGSIGWIHPEIIPGSENLIIAVINISAVSSKFNINVQYPKQYKYSPIIEDITLVLPPDALVGKIIDHIRNTKPVTAVSISTMWQNSLTVKVEFNSDAKQLTQIEANQAKDKIIADLSGKFNVTFKTNTTVIPAQAGIYTDIDSGSSPE